MLTGHVLVSTDGSVVLVVGRRTYTDNRHGHACADVVVDGAEDVEEDGACGGAEGGEGDEPEVDEEEDGG